MKLVEFIDLIANHWTDPPEMTEEKCRRFSDKARRFSERQLRMIADKLLERYSKRPEIAEIYRIATELGFMVNQQPTEPQDKWEATDCKYCGGEGWLSVLLHIEYVEKRDPQGKPCGKRKEITVRKVWPRSDKSQIGFEWAEGDALFQFRCNCDAGARVPSTAFPVYWPDKFQPCNSNLVFKSKPEYTPAKPVQEKRKDLRPMNQILKEVEDLFDGWK